MIPAPTTIALPLLATQVPPGVGSVSVMPEPTHTIERLVIAPMPDDALGEIVMTETADPTPQVALVTVYEMGAVPDDKPVTTPPEVTEAFVLPLLHTPLLVASDRLIVAPWHTLVGPAIADIPDDGLTLTVFSA